MTDSPDLLGPTYAILPFVLAAAVAGLVLFAPVFLYYRHIVNHHRDAESARYVAEENRRIQALEVQMHVAATSSDQLTNVRTAYVPPAVDESKVSHICVVVGRCAEAGMTRAETLTFLGASGGTRTTLGALVDRAAEELHVQLSTKRQPVERHWVLIQAENLRPLVVNGNLAHSEPYPS